MSGSEFETEGTVYHAHQLDVVAVSSESHGSEDHGGAARAADNSEAGIVLIPVEDFGAGLVRLIGGGVNGLAALGKGDALPNAIKKVAGDVESVVSKAVQGVNGLLNRTGGAKE